MKTSSAKAKGRRLCQEIAASILARYPFLEADDVQVTSSGAPGEDIKLSPVARTVLNFSFEAKNVEKLNFREAFKQAKGHAAKRPGSVPLLISRSNRTETLATLRWDDLLDLIQDGAARRIVVQRQAEFESLGDKQN